MTQRNIDTMDIIVTKIADGMPLSMALSEVYTKRNVCIPYKEKYCKVKIMDFGMSSRTTNALLRAKFRTIGDVIEFCGEKKITDIVGFGKSSGTEFFESMLNYCWAKMSNDERVNFLIDTVERNSDYLRAEIAL